MPHKLILPPLQLHLHKFWNRATFFSLIRETFETLRKKSLEEKTKWRTTQIVFPLYASANIFKKKLLCIFWWKIIIDVCGVLNYDFFSPSPLCKFFRSLLPYAYVENLLCLVATSMLSLKTFFFRIKKCLGESTAHTQKLTISALTIFSLQRNSWNRLF